MICEKDDIGCYKNELGKLGKEGGNVIIAKGKVWRVKGKFMNTLMIRKEQMSYDFLTKALKDIVGRKIQMVIRVLPREEGDK